MRGGGGDSVATDLNTTHRGSDGSDHSKVEANESAIGLNTIHRGSDGSDHSIVEQLSAGGETALHNHAPGAFTDLEDVAPDSIASADIGKVVKVGSGLRLEFVDEELGGSFTDLDDTPADYTDEAGNCVVANAGEDGLEFGAAPGGGGAGFDSKCSVYLSAEQTTGAAGWRRINFNLEHYDSDNEFDNATNHDFTAAVAGYYSIKASIQFKLLGAGKEANVAIFKNGAEQKRGRHVHYASSYDVVLCACDLYLVQNDFIDVRIYHNAVGNIQIGNSSTQTWMMIHRFG